MRNDKIFKTMAEIILRKGSLEIIPGEYFIEAEDLIEEQKTWGDTDNCKNFDFTEFDYWVVTDCGAIPSGFNSIDEYFIELQARDGD